jgi:hypothetical protein
MTAVLATLQASNDWAGIRAEMDYDAPPATAYGKLEAAFLAQGPQS